MSIKSTLIISLAIAVLGAAVAAIWLVVSKDATEGRQEALTLEEHLEAEFSRLMQGKDNHSLPPAEQAIADNLNSNSSMADFKAAFLHVAARNVSGRLADHMRRDRRVDSMTTIRIVNTTGRNGWPDLERALKTAIRMDPVMQSHYTKLRTATTDTADEANYGHIVSGTSSAAQSVLEAADSDYIQWEKSSDRDLLNDLPKLAQLLSMRARMLALMQDRDATLAPAALWRVIDKLNLSGPQNLSAAARAVRLVLDDGGYQLFEERLCGENAFAAFTSIYVHWPSCDQALVSAAYDQARDIEKLMWLQPEDEPEVIDQFVAQIGMKYGNKPLGQWINDLYEENRANVDETLDVAAELHDALHQDPTLARSALADLESRLSPYRDRLEAVCLTKLEALYVQALACERGRFKNSDGSLSATDVLASVPSDSGLTATQDGNSVIIKLAEDDLLADYFPAECRNAQATLAIR
ncbi:MAG: hypothetical protein H6839_14820 [Planctomycetes bacterium]|nr:hypothetical protein [Planctomycetota bacterium]